MLSAESSPRATLASARKSYARIPEVLPIPNLIELQLDSFQWFIEKGLRELLRRDQPDQGLHRQGDGAPVPRLRVRAAEVHRARVPDEGPDLQPPALRQRRAAHQGDRRDPAPARLHGRLPDDDRPGDVHHQRRRARRRLPARPLAGGLLQRHRGPDQRSDPVQRQGHPEPGRLARVRDQQQGPPLGQGGPQAQDRRDHPAPRRRLRVERGDRRAVRQRRHGPRPSVHRLDPRQGPHQDPAGRPDRGLQEAPPGRSADRRQRPPAGREPVLQLPALRPRPGRPLQVRQEARRRRGPDGDRAAPRRADDHPRGHRRDRRPSHRAEHRGPEADRRAALDGRRHRPPRQSPDPGQRRAHPERVPDRPPPDGAGRPRADDDPGDRQGHPERAHQHPAGRGRDEGVLRGQPALPVHGPDEPAGRADLASGASAPSGRAACPASGPASTSATSTTATTGGSARSRRRKVRTSGSSARSRPTAGSTATGSSRRPTARSSGPSPGTTRTCASTRPGPTSLAKGGEVVLKAGQTFTEAAAAELKKQKAQAFSIRPVVTEEIEYLPADEEEQHVVAQANAPLDETGPLRRPSASRRATGTSSPRPGRARSSTWTSRPSRSSRSRPRSSRSSSTTTRTAP